MPSDFGGCNESSRVYSGVDRLMDIALRVAGRASAPDDLPAGSETSQVDILHTVVARAHTLRKSAL